MIQDGQKVSVTYTLTLDDGSVVDSNVDREPLVYEQGAEQILPELERQISQLEVGGEAEITLSPEDGYGPVHEEARQTVPAEQIPEGAREIGAMLTATDGEGNQRAVRVAEVSDGEVVVDFNHPLAGETLHFKVKVVGVE